MDMPIPQISHTFTSRLDAAGTSIVKFFSVREGQKASAWTQKPQIIASIQKSCEDDIVPDSLRNIECVLPPTNHDENRPDLITKHELCECVNRELRAFSLNREI